MNHNYDKTKTELEIKSKCFFTTSTSSKNELKFQLLDAAMPIDIVIDKGIGLVCIIIMYNDND